MWEVKSTSSEEDQGRSIIKQSLLPSSGDDVPSLNSDGNNVLPPSSKLNKLFRNVEHKSSVEGLPSIDMTESLPEVTDVVIIGAGPSGLTLACELARRGINFLIFDINARPVTQSRALMLQSRTLEILADLGLAESAIRNGHILRGSSVFINMKPVLDLKFTGVQSPFPFALILEQSETEKLLIERLESLGCRVHRPVAVWKVEVPEVKDHMFLADVMSSGNSPAAISMVIAAHNALVAAGPVYQSGMSTPKVNATRSSVPTAAASVDGSTGLRNLPSFLGEQYCTIHVKSLDPYGRPVDSSVGQIRCKYVVGCDGAKSSVRKAVDIPFHLKSEPTEFLVADIIVRWGMDMQPDRLQLIQNPSGVLVCIPMSENRWRIICMRKCLGEVEDAVEPFQRLQGPEFEELSQIVEALVPGTRLESSIWTSAFCVSCCIAEVFRRSAALLVGDAAHVHPPTFGQGMNTGIQDAYNLGWKLAAVIRGAPVHLLDTYSQERTEVAEEIARTSQRLFESLIKPGFAVRCFFTTLGPMLGGLDFFSNAFSRGICQTDLRYTSSSIISKNFLSRGAADPGSRLPNASIVGLPVLYSTPINYGNEWMPQDDLGSETPKSLVNFTRGGHHTLLLCVHVLPPGTKARTIFGCERSEEAVRWNTTCLEKLARLGRLLVEAFKGREAEIVYGGLKVVWVLCGLVNFKNPKNNVALGQIRDHVPHRLMYFFVQGSRVAGHAAITVDYEDGVHSTLGLKLADPDGFYAADKAGAFVLIRPDGHISCNGYAGDNQATGFAFDYALSWFS